MYIRMFCDGSSKGNGSEDAVGGYAAVIYAKNENGKVFKKEVAGKVDGATNNEMELSAVLKGLEAIKKEVRGESMVHIQSDSKYVVNIFTKWLDGWKKADWKKKDKGEILNLFLIKEIDMLIGDYKKVVFEHQPRCSNPWLKQADELATK